MNTGMTDTGSAGKKGYHTKQKEQILAYMKGIPGKHVTASQVYAALKDGGSRIGSTTVYRSLENLVNEGVVKKYHIEVGCPACFEYVGENESSAVTGTQAASCFHCKCEKCGRLIHVHCEELEAYFRHLQMEHDFTIDPMRIDRVKVEETYICGERVY